MKKLAERPDEVRRVLRAMLKANNYISKNRDGTVQVLVNWAKSKPEFAEAAYDPPSALSAPTAAFPKTACAWCWTDCASR